MSFSLWILPMYLKSISGTKAQSFLSSVDCFLLLAPCLHCSSWPQCHTPFLRLDERVGQMRHLGRNLERNSLSGAHNVLAALFPAHTHSPASQVLLHAHVLLFSPILLQGSAQIAPPPESLLLDPVIPVSSLGQDGPLYSNSMIKAA